VEEMTMSTRGYASGAATTEPGIRYTALDGVVGGLIGGVLMGMTSMVLFWLRDLGFWYPLRLIASLVRWPDAAAERGFEMGPVLVGMMIHMALSMMFGVAMVWLGRRLPGQVVVRAVVLSLVLWAATNFLVLPIIDQTFYDRFPAWIFAIGHLMYGLGLGGYLASQGERTAE
jgi:hypothetical protein